MTANEDFNEGSFGETTVGDRKVPRSICFGVSEVSWKLAPCAGEASCTKSCGPWTFREVSPREISIELPVGNGWLRRQENVVYDKGDAFVKPKRYW